MIVQIDGDVFKEMLLERADSFNPAENYSEEFWIEVVDRLEDMGFMSDPQYNDPKYIIDNIAVNGEIFPVDEIRDHLNDNDIEEFDEEYNGDVEEWAADKGYDIIDGNIIMNWGL